MQKNNFFKKLLAFAEDKGFYIILVLCAVAIGVSGYVLFFTNNDPAIDEGLEAGLTAQVPDAPLTTIPPVTVDILEPDTPDEPVSGAVDGVPVVPEKPTQPAPVIIDVPASNPVKVTKPTYVWPCDGEVIRDFSGDTLVYDDTMADWRVHNGTDFACQENDRIYAVAKGTVKSVHYDELLGNVVVLQHGDGLETHYCGLLPNTTLKNGMSVNAGDVIGGAGRTMKSESKMETHLHFSVVLNGNYIDPLSLNFE